jgi:hypothetical protein
LETVRVDVLARRVICVLPKPELVPLFRQIQVFEENEGGCFYIRAASNAVEPFLKVYAEIVREVARRKTARQAIAAKGWRHHTCPNLDSAA